MAFKNWVSWTGYTRLYARTSPEFDRPNVIIHAAESVRTPVGEAPLAIVLYKSSPGAYPEIKDIVSPSIELSEYIAERLFAGSAFESYVPRRGILVFNGDRQKSCGVRIHIGRGVFYAQLTSLGEAQIVTRAPSSECPVHTQALEQTSSEIAVLVDTTLLHVQVETAETGWGAPAAYSPVGFWARLGDISFADKLKRTA